MHVIHWGSFRKLHKIVLRLLRGFHRLKLITNRHSVLFLMTNGSLYVGNGFHYLGCKLCGLYVQNGFTNKLFLHDFVWQKKWNRLCRFLSFIFLCGL